MSEEKLIVTCALLYANGDVHLGHLLEHIQADIWVRFHRLLGKKCYFICADDTHGTPVMLKAQQLGITPEELILQVKESHLADLTNFSISFDNYHNTNSEENKELVYAIYAKLKQHNKISTHIVNQLYDEEKNVFLPDRFVKGTCPKCKVIDQYGDNCESCGATYLATELIEPYSTLSGSKPILKESEHYFFNLSDCQSFLRQWLNTPKRLQAEALNKMDEWFKEGLQNWDISRDKPYFGFEIPNATDKYFYVWLDAPIGYLSSLLDYCNKNNLNFKDTWQSGDLYHFIGKDILYFHALFWPAMLHYSENKTPKSIFAHGFLTVNGYKMSKSRGTFITAKNYISCGLSPTFYRYYIASKLSNKIEDVDFSLDDFVARVNSDLVGKFINVVARSSNFITKYFDNRLAPSITNVTLLDALRSVRDEIATFYVEREYSKAIKLIMANVDEINQYIDHVKPWIMAKDPSKMEQLHDECTLLVNAFCYLSIYLKPVVPDLINKVESFLNIAELKWSNLDSLLINHHIKTYHHIINRIEPAMIAKLIKNQT